jgi:uncharacterized protein YodC (DUF2158 family)
MSTNFKAGDAVMLKSGGPKMTIEVIENGRADCVWFSKDELLTRTFGTHLLIEFPKNIIGISSSSRGRYSELNEYY